MSSFPEHCVNIENLKELGFYVEDCFEDGKVSTESWGYDEQVDTMERVICELNSRISRIEEYPTDVSCYLTVEEAKAATQLKKRFIEILKGE